MYSPSLADKSFGAECLDVAYCRDVDNDYPADGSAYEIDEDYPVKEGATAQATHPAAHRADALCTRET